MDEPYKDEYMTAYQHGKENSCLDKYESACPISIFSMLHFWFTDLIAWFHEFIYSI